MYLVINKCTIVVKYMYDQVKKQNKQKKKNIPEHARFKSCHLTIPI